MPPRLLKTSVRELIGFVLRSGDLVSGGFAQPDRMIEGTRGHQKVQRARPAGYQSEVPVSYLVDTEAITLEISGRIDGLLAEGDTVLIEEIKTTEAEFEELPPANPAHWAQAKVYAFIVSEQSGLDCIDVQLTYLQLETWQLYEDRRSFSLDELAAFFSDLVERYLHWARIYHQWCVERDRSLQALDFPFAEYRPGQRDLAVTTYRAIENQGRAFIQAPTGIGKTVSTLFPALKALALGHAEKIFYLTAKTVGRTVVEKTIDEIRARGARIKNLTLTARDKICFKPNGGSSCDPEQCEFAQGYYDRINDALEDIFTHDAFTRLRIEEHAQKHKVCPFEFSLDLSLWSDIITCDYNYVFDPRAFLKRFFQDAKGEYALLIDEAHNLVDRAREMFSATLYKSEILGLKRQVGKTHPDLGKKLDALNRYFVKLGKKVEKEGDGSSWIDPKLSTDLIALVHNALKAAEKVLAQGPLDRILFPGLGLRTDRRTLRRTLYHLCRERKQGGILPALLPRSIQKYPPGPRTRQCRCILLGHPLAPRLFPRPARWRRRRWNAATALTFPTRQLAPAPGRPHRNDLQKTQRNVQRYRRIDRRPHPPAPGQLPGLLSLLPLYG